MIDHTLPALALSLAALEWSKLLVALFFVFCFGAICGSFINVLVYRLPLGQSVVSPPSACPKCGTKLTWRENIPVLGWILLWGKCRYCKASISPEYPIVEFIVALLFSVTYCLWFADAHVLRQIGFDPNPWRPEWAREGFTSVWPVAILFAALFFSLVAVTLIDAKTFHIPLLIPWLLTVLAMVVHPASAWWIGPLDRSPHSWVIPVVDWPLIGLSLGAALGLAIAAGLLHLKLLPRSFADYEKWAEANAPRPKIDPSAEERTEEPSDPKGSAVLRALFFAGPIVAGMFGGLSLGMRFGNAGAFIAVGAGAGMVIGLLLRRLVPEGDPSENDPQWVQYPHARREVLKETLFLILPAALAVVGYVWATNAVGPWTTNHQTGALVHSAGAPPLWLSAFGGSLFGMIVGGGVVWALRVGGSLAFGKEAMGLGDVHLMAAVGACLGWIDPTLAFFIAPFFGIAWVVSARVISSLRKTGKGAVVALPYGPHLAAATVFVVLGKPLVETLLSVIASQTIDLP